MRDAEGKLPLNQLPHKRRADEDRIHLLEGVRVLDLTTSIAGPYATLLLADFGAEVIKIERREGDDSRGWGPPFLAQQSLWFLSVNRNKRSLTLDFSTSQGRDLLHALVVQHDVVVTNQIGSSQRKLGIDHATLAALRPGLVHVSITGFGVQGERSDLPSYDLIAEGYSGVMDLTGEADAPPQKVGTPAADLLAGMDAAMAVAAALYRRRADGKGCAIDISMVESMTRFMAPRLVPFLGSGELPRRSGARDSVIAVYQSFDTADQPISLGLGNDGIWRRFWAAVGEPDYGADARFRSNKDRRAARPEIVARIQSVLRQRKRGDWLELFAQQRIPAGPINRLDEVAADRELQARGMLYSVSAFDTSIPQVGLGIRIDDSSETYRSPPPGLGEHTDAVLREVLGLKPEQIEQLREQHII
ncbi:MAG: CoA transferase [Burkholderiales bacterium]|nr:CoA transferase [Burkholderiales bacterium]